MIQTLVCILFSLAVTVGGTVFSAFHSLRAGTPGLPSGANDVVETGADTADVKCYVVNNENYHQGREAACRVHLRSRQCMTKVVGACRIQCHIPVFLTPDCAGLLSPRCY